MLGRATLKAVRIASGKALGQDHAWHAKGTLGGLCGRRDEGRGRVGQIIKDFMGCDEAHF